MDKETREGGKNPLPFSLAIVPVPLLVAACAVFRACPSQYIGKIKYRQRAVKQAIRGA